MFIKQYQKYFIKNIFYQVVILTFVLTFLAAIPQLLKLLPLLDKGIKISDFIGMSTLIIPFIIFTITPVITLIANLMIFHKYKEERQLIIISCAGESEFQQVKPALIVASIMTIISLLISFYLLPASYSALKNRLRQFRDNYFSHVIDVKTFHQISKDVTVFVDKKSTNGLLYGITLFDDRNRDEKAFLFAKSGALQVINNSPVLTLYEGYRQAYDSDGNVTRLHFADLTIEIKNELEENLVAKSKNHLELFIHEMLWPDKSYFTQTQQQSLIAEGHQRILWPLFNIVLTLCALSIFLKIPYSRKAINYKQIIVVTLPLILVIYLHFSWQKNAYHNQIYIYLCYCNLIFISLLSVLLLKTKRYFHI